MPIPPLEPTGLLPPGIHDATLDEIQATFGSGNDTRTAIMAGLNEVVAIIRMVPGIRELYVDGSFVTSKATPEDVDVVASVAPSDLQEFEANPYAKALMNHPVVKSKYMVDLLIGPDVAGLVRILQELRTDTALGLGVDLRHNKGILRVHL